MPVSDQTEKAELGGLFLEPGHIAEDGVVVVPDAVGLTDLVEQAKQLPFPGAGDLIGIAVGADVPLLQTREFSVQLGIKILPIPIPESL